MLCFGSSSGRGVTTLPKGLYGEVVAYSGYKPPALDVGCGDHPRGNVNVDLCGKVDVKADGCHLPFRDGCFSFVFCIHVIEHVQDPYRLLRELMRVANGEIYLRCPHRLGTEAKRDGHVYFFRKKWFLDLFKKWRVNASVDYSKWRRRFWWIPEEIEVLIHT